MKTDLITSLALLWGATGLFVADVRVVLAADGDRDSDFPQVLTPSRLPQRLDEAPSRLLAIPSPGDDLREQRVVMRRNLRALTHPSVDAHVRQARQTSRSRARSSKGASSA